LHVKGLRPFPCQRRIFTLVFYPGSFLPSTAMPLLHPFYLATISLAAISLTLLVLLSHNTATRTSTSIALPPRASIRLWLRMTHHHQPRDASSFACLHYATALTVVFPPSPTVAPQTAPPHRRLTRHPETTATFEADKTTNVTMNACEHWSWQCCSTLVQCKVLVRSNEGKRKKEKEKTSIHSYKSF